MGPVSVARTVGAPTPSRTARDPTGTPLAPWIDLAEARVRRSLRVALAAGLAELEPIELPPVSGSADEQVIIGELAPMYFVAELERAGLLRSAETMAALYVSGGVRSELAGPVADELIGLWRRRHTRFSATERQALFRRLFASPGTDLAGGPTNADFDLLLARVADNLISVGDDSSLASRTGLTTSATQLARSIAGHVPGVPRLATRELITFVRSAISVLDDPSVAIALGQRSMWDAVRHLERQAGRSAPISLHVRRARSGLMVLAWLGDHLGAIQAGQLPPITPEVVSAALDWLDATLALWGESGR